MPPVKPQSPAKDLTEVKETPVLAASEEKKPEVPVPAKVDESPLAAVRSNPPVVLEEPVEVVEAPAPKYDPELHEKGFFGFPHKGSMTKIVDHGEVKKVVFIGARPLDEDDNAHYPKWDKEERKKNKTYQPLHGRLVDERILPITWQDMTKVSRAAYSVKSDEEFMLYAVID